VAANLVKELNPQDAKATQMRLAKQLRGGRVESESIFSDELAESDKQAKAKADAERESPAAGGGLNRDKDVLARAVDPDPLSRVRWQRKMVIRHVTKSTDPFSREPRSARIRRTEKELREKSPWLATSVKKLVHLSRQIAGKSVDEALVQMRFSKKKMAKEVAYQLELARDRAIVERGMGLGGAAAAKGGEEAGSKVVEKIQTKDGKHIEVADPTKLYVAQSWVERGPLRGVRKSPRARGRIDRLNKPSTSMFAPRFSSIFLLDSNIVCF
jgi:ribosomal protein L22